MGAKGNHQRSSMLASWCVAALTASAIYVGTYLYLVRRRVDGMYSISSVARTPVKFRPEYSSKRGNDQWLSRIFRPLNELDQKIRPDYWRGELLPNDVQFFPGIPEFTLRHASQSGE